MYACSANNLVNVEGGRNDISMSLNAISHCLQPDDSSRKTNVTLLSQAIACKII